MPNDSGGFSWGQIISAGIQVVGSMVQGMGSDSASQEEKQLDLDWEREKFEWEKQQAGLDREARGGAVRLAQQKALLDARLEAAKLDPGLKGFSRQAERLQDGATIDQNAVNALISGYTAYGAKR